MSREYIDQPLGPLKIYGTVKGKNDKGVTGWYYPLFTTREEAMLHDLENGGKGIYDTLNFYNTIGEFYFSNSLFFRAQEREPLVYTKYSGNGAENPFDRIKNRLSLLVPEQLPDFVQSDYTQFVIFLKAYYEFLEQNNTAQEVLQNLEKYRDIDETTSNLIEKFLGTYSEDYFLSNTAENRFIIKRIRDIYKTKGTEKAYETLFYILYRETIDFFYPGNYILKASAGKWVRNYTLRVKPVNTFQNLYEFENTEIFGETSGATAIVRKVFRFNLGEFEVFEIQLDPSSVKGTFTKEETIYANKILQDRSGTITLRAILYSIVSKVDIIDGALGYTEGSPVTISDNEGKYAIAKISGVNRFGKITSIDVIEPGVNYSDAAIADAGLPSKELLGTYSLTEGRVTVTFSEKHGMELGNNIKVNYFSNDTFSPVSNTSHNATVVSIPNVRTIKFRYPGF